MVNALVWDKEKCIFCGGCVAVCPPGNVFVLHNRDQIIEHENCTTCGVCVSACPMGVLSLQEE